MHVCETLPLRKLLSAHHLVVAALAGLQRRQSSVSKHAVESLPATLQPQVAKSALGVHALPRETVDRLLHSICPVVHSADAILGAVPHASLATRALKAAAPPASTFYPSDDAVAGTLQRLRVQVLRVLCLSLHAHALLSTVVAMPGDCFHTM